ncbi:MAG TPA: CRTAC1 family protein, partial [Vicinamibacteria bacterium]|nr:CRTAC1 family protein [Vicinamibacteria bacterium]
NDGWMDLFVANDTVQNFLFMNRGKGRWEEIGLASEVGFSANGQPRSGMGVDAVDFEGDGWQDLFVANVDQEMFSFYRNNRDESFTDVAHGQGIAAATRLLSGWGLRFFDYDNDGLVDLFLANGHPDDMVDSYGGLVTYREPLLLFHNEGGQLRDVSGQGGAAFERRWPARGLAIGDFDNDGRIDVLVGNNGEAPILLRNRSGEGHHWVGLKLEGRTCNRDAVGARLTWPAGRAKRTRLKTAGGSYLSSHDPREVIGLGAAPALPWLEVRWPAPSDRVDTLKDVPIDRYLRVVEGEGIVP